MNKEIFTTRYGPSNTIEVLVMWEDGGIFSSQWVCQSSLHGHGLKELSLYIKRQYLYSPLWNYILNIAEVGVGWELTNIPS